MIGARYLSRTEANPDGAVVLELGPNEAERLMYLINRAQASCCWDEQDKALAPDVASQLHSAVGWARQGSRR